MTRTERTYYLISCLYRLSWSALGPTYALFLLGRGLDILQVNLVLAVYLITTCLFEVPTGAVADVFGRKVSFILSCVVRALAFGLYFFSDPSRSFWSPSSSTPSARRWQPARSTRGRSTAFAPTATSGPCTAFLRAPTCSRRPARSSVASPPPSWPSAISPCRG
jgi:MFS family permease